MIIVMALMETREIVESLRQCWATPTSNNANPFLVGPVELQRQ